MITGNMMPDSHGMIINEKKERAYECHCLSSKHGKNCFIYFEGKSSLHFRHYVIYKQLLELKNVNLTDFTYLQCAWLKIEDLCQLFLDVSIHVWEFWQFFQMLVQKIGVGSQWDQKPTQDHSQRPAQVQDLPAWDLSFQLLKHKFFVLFKKHSKQLYNCLF